MLSDRGSARAWRAHDMLLWLRVFTAPPFRGPMLVAIVGFAASAVIDVHTDLPLLCGGDGDHLSLTAFAVSSQLLLAVNPPLSLALAWLAMLIAMMTPLIAIPLGHVRASSLVGRRPRAAAVFLLGYFGIWWLAGLPLLVMALLFRLVAGTVLSAFVLAGLLALAWSASPMQQAAQNRAHRLRRLGLFGLAADRDCLAFGAALAGWCLASCWVWMLVPLFVSHGHIPAMIAVAGIVMAERLRGPGPLRWRAPVLLSAVGRGWANARAPEGWRRAQA